MVLKIWKSGTKREFSVKLIQDEEGLDVCLVDQHGDVHYYLLSLTADGTVRRYGHIIDPHALEATGLKTNKFGQILLEPTEDEDSDEDQADGDEEDDNEEVPEKKIPLSVYDPTDPKPLSLKLEPSVTARDSAAIDLAICEAGGNVFGKYLVTFSNTGLIRQKDVMKNNMDLAIEPRTGKVKFTGRDSSDE